MSQSVGRHGAEFRPASRVASIGVSEILQISFRAAALKRAGADIIILGTGEPDFDTPEPVKEAAARAMHRGETKYTVLDGRPELKAAVAAKFSRENGLDYGLDEITCSAGAKQVIFNALMASLEPGDEVLLPTPCWLSYLDIVRIVGGVPVTIPCREENGFLLDPADLERAITPRTRWVFLNSPSNPTGAAYDSQSYRPVLDVLLRHPQVWILADDIYEHILYDNHTFVTPAALEPALKERTLTVNGVSKAYAMTGWRLGYGGGPAPLIRAMAVVQSQSTSCPSSITQAAAIEALGGEQGIVEERRRSFQERRDLVVSRLNAMPGIRCRKPEGAFYTFASCEGVLGKTTPDGTRLSDDRAFCSYLLEAAGVAVVPGSGFGLSPYFRISYATSLHELTEALSRIARAVAALA